MKKKFLLFILFSIFVISSLTFLLIVLYLDPYAYRKVAIFSISFVYLLATSSLLTILLYGYKSIYYRGEVYVSHIFSSLRQGFFISTYFGGIITFISLGALSYLTSFLLFVILLFVELMIQNMEL